MYISGWRIEIAQVDVTRWGSVKKLMKNFELKDETQSEEHFKGELNAAFLSLMI